MLLNLLVNTLDWCSDSLWQSNHYITHDETLADITAYALILRTVMDTTQV